MPRVSASVRCPVRLLTLALLITGAGTAPAAGQQTLSGRVLESESLRPVQGATVVVEGALRLVTGPGGEFQVQLQQARPLAIRIEHPGFLPHDERVSWTRDGQESLFLLRSEPVVLPAVVGRAHRAATPVRLAGFRQRMELGIGHFLDAEDIRSGGVRPSDAFRTVPGMAVDCGYSPHACTIRFQRAKDSLGRGCPVQYYVDGAPLDLWSIDEMFRREDIAGIEIYNSANVPVQFRTVRASRCGVILVWTTWR